MRLLALAFFVFLASICASAQNETQRDRIRTILKPCRPNAPFKELAQCLQRRAHSLSAELGAVKAAELEVVITACKVGEDTGDDAQYKDETACLVSGIAHVADDGKQREYALKVCSQRSFDFHAQCLFTFADLTTDAGLKSTINLCKTVSASPGRSQCLIDGLVKLEGTRGGISPFIPWWWNNELSRK